MAVTVGESLIPKLKKYGVKEHTAELCYNCGNCTATCNLTGNGGGIFPRKTIRLLQLGLANELKQDTAPWNCYYCGDCTESCPRGAEPAELMMGVRRYLTAEYDVTGMGRRIYTSNKWMWIAVFFWFIGPMIYLGALHLFGFASVNTDTTALNEFAPVDIIWWTSHVYMVYLLIILFSGIRNMWKNVMSKEAMNGIEVKRSDYISNLRTLFVNGFTQRRWRDCAQPRQKTRWLKHFGLVVSYITMFVLIVAFLPWFQTDTVYAIYHPQRAIGYVAAILLLATTLEIFYQRLRKRDEGEELHKYSHHTDWMLPLSIFLVALTGILVSLLRIADLPWPTYIMYAIHLGFTAVMLSTEVGIGKWTHIFYRPFGYYFEAVKQQAKARAAAT